MKDIKDKSDDLRNKGKKILGLRRDIKMLNSENVRLKQAMDTETAIERECEARL